MREGSAADVDPLLHNTDRSWRERDANGVCSTCQSIHSRCQLHLNAHALCIDCDKSAVFGAVNSEERGDFVVGTVREGDASWWWVFLEMKSGTIRPEKARAQLQALADRLHQIPNVPKPSPPTIDFVPVVLTGRGRLHPSDQRRLNSLKVRFYGVERTIIVKSCGSRLTDLLKPAGLKQKRRS